jgi:hypothetical protein
MKVKGDPLSLSASSRNAVASMCIVWTVFTMSLNLALSSYG